MVAGERQSGDPNMKVCREKEAWPNPSNRSGNNNDISPLIVVAGGLAWDGRPRTRAAQTNPHTRTRFAE